jgi:hypothetical protein
MKKNFDPHSARGKDYEPFIKIHEIPSLGRSSRIVSWTVGRAHHLLSKLELQHFYAFDWADAIVDIREQFRLDLKETLEIADELGVPHPRKIRETGWNTMTTDFVLTLADKREIAVCVKYEQDLSRRRVGEKLEIEAEYWRRQGVVWKIATEKSLPLNLATNVEWIHPAHDVDFEPYEVKSAEKCLERLLGTGRTLREATAMTEDLLCLAPGYGLTLLRHLLATKVWLTDMTQKIDPAKPLAIRRNGIGYQQVDRVA